MALAANLGLPRVGGQRELKFAIEKYWRGQLSRDELMETAKELRARHWKLQQDAGIDIIPSNDFSLYDHVLDMTALLGAVPSRYGFSGGNVDLDTYFAMARGRQQGGQDVVAMEMTKWLDTNYHYIVPEIDSTTTFALSSTKPFDQFEEAQSLGITTRPVILGPLSYLLLAKSHEEGFNPLQKLDQLLEIYADILNKFKSIGATSVQIDEPCLATDIDEDVKLQYQDAYAKLNACGVDLTLTTYFGGLRDNLELALNLMTAAIHVDLVRGSEDIDVLLELEPRGRKLSLGLIEGRNIWKADLAKALSTAEKFAPIMGSENLIIAPSCSLLHCPVDLAAETELDHDIKDWLAFSVQKLDEVVAIRDALNGQKNDQFFADNAASIQRRQQSRKIHNQAVKAAVDSITPELSQRDNPFAARKLAQQSHIKLPALPTTTIGSFPQTKEVRLARSAHKKGNMTDAQYDAFLGEQIQNAVKIQEDIDIDVLVHGEFERNDMVEYFGEQLDGFAFTKNGWVQSYGTRCVKPPVIFGDITRPSAMTVAWTTYAQALTDRPVKGMLTGPVTILQWSFVRDDQPRQTTCQQIALAIRDEVVDLEKAGISIIQIDEPAFREGLPLRQADQGQYLNWATESFRISASGVTDKTQIHTHMCYSEFNDIMDSIADLDADVISIETSRSAMELLSAFVDFRYPNDIGPGVYDIHSPREPGAGEMTTLLHKALDVLKPDQVWVNPDCGLKTRRWEEVTPALKNMVDAAKAIRGELEENRKNAS